LVSRPAIVIGVGKWPSWKGDQGMRKRLFLIVLVAGFLTALLGLEALNHNHRSTSAIVEADGFPQPDSAICKSNPTLPGCPTNPNTQPSG
jgi:hypothetical protein